MLVEIFFKNVGTQETEIGYEEAIIPNLGELKKYN